MDPWQAVVVGVVQGVAEWLPVSSEAVTTLVMQRWLGMDAAAAVDAALWLHTGTMLAALLYFRGAFRAAVVDAWRRVRALDRGMQGRAPFIVVATVVTGVVGGVLYVGGVKTLARYPGLFSGVMAGALLVTAGLRLYAPGADRVVEAVGPRDAVLVGVLQGAAVVPGVSRSGATVFGLLYRGFDAGEAFRLSFLLSVPAVLGAGIGLELLSGFAVTPPLVLAAAVACVVGYASIGAVLRVADRSGVAVLCVVLAVIAVLPVLL